MAVDIFNLLEVSRISQTDPTFSDDASPLWIWSDPGLGKTSIIGSYCKSVNHYMLKVILGPTPAPDLSGFWIPDLKSGTVEHLITDKLIGHNIPEAEGYDGICVFFDEVANSGDEQQTAIQSMVEDGELGGKRKADNVWYVFASNHPGSNCGANEVVLSLRQRAADVHVLNDDQANKREGALKDSPYISVEKELFPTWLELAIEDWDIDDRITGYLHYTMRDSAGGAVDGIDSEGSAFHRFDPMAADPNQPSPRSWSKLSNILKITDDEDTIRTYASGLIGAAQFNHWWGWCKLAQKVPLYEEVVAPGGDPMVPSITTPDQCYAVMMNIARGVRGRGEDITKEEVEAVLQYLRRLPETYAAYGWVVCKKNNPAFTERTDAQAAFIADYLDAIR